MLPLLLILAACTPNPVPGPSFIAPLDGQTAVDRAATLRVHVTDLELPPDYPVPDDFVRVVDLDQGGFVDGYLLREGDDLRFRPIGGWAPGHRYVWSVGEVPSLDRAPEYAFPEGVYGEAVFATSDEVDVLGASLEDDGSVCVVLSRTVGETDVPVEVTVDDELVGAVSYVLRSETDLVDGLLLDGEDEGVSVACLVWPEDSEAPVPGPGSSLRVWWDGRGPWRSTLDRTAAEVLLERRRSL